MLRKLPDIDSPLIYGLPFSIDRTVQRFNSSELINNLKIVNSADAEELKFSREAWSSMLKPIFTLWKGLDKSILETGFK
jgi:dynein heavy chain 2